MADIEMDLDPHPAHDYEGQADEDLIDYDSDVEVQHNEPSWTMLDPMEHSGHEVIDSDSNVLSMVEDNWTGPDIDTIVDMSEPPEQDVELTGNDDVHQQTATSDVNIESTFQQPDLGNLNSAGESAETEVHHPQDMQNGDVDDHETAHPHTLDDAEYGYDGQTEEQPEAAHHDGGDVQGSGPNPDDGQGSHHHEPSAAATLEPEGVHSLKSDTEAEKDEITWEEDEEEDNQIQESNGDDKKDDTDNANQEVLVGGNHAGPENAEAVPESSFPGQGLAELKADLGDDETEPVSAEAEEKTISNEDGYEDSHNTMALPNNSTDEPVEPQHEPAQNIASGSDDVDFPSITVQYKGDEFSFFSLDSNGFFSDISILDSTMESVLASLRVELANEIASEDELVLQVDELGLEFAESHIRETLSAITFRQILEIFDLLVKNQDPDSTRTLYTYLSTKPNANRRLEFLVESATAGKGLDEVIHLFESPLPHTLAPNANGDAAQEYEHLDLYESETGVNDGDDRKHDHGNGDEQSDTLEPEESLAKEEIGEDQQQTHNFDESTETAERTELDYLEPAEDVVSALTTETQLNAASGDARTDSDTVHYTDVYDNTHSEGRRGELELRFEDNAAHTGTDVSSTTNTLNGDHHAYSGLENEKEEPSLDHPDEQEADTDELAEIDWRDDPEQDDGDAGTSTSAGKRSRVDDESSMEMKDVKRRRS